MPSLKVLKWCQLDDFRAFDIFFENIGKKIPLSDVNDTMKLTFAEIANLIEEQL